MQSCQNLFFLPSNFDTLQPTNGSLDGYEHIVNVEYCPPVLSESPNFPSEAAEAKEAAQNDPSTQNTVDYHEIMEGTISILRTRSDNILLCIKSQSVLHEDANT